MKNEILCYSVLKCWYLNPLRASPTEWSNSLKQLKLSLGLLPMNCLSVFDHFMRLALKGLNMKMRSSCVIQITQNTGKHWNERKHRYVVGEKCCFGLPFSEVWTIDANIVERITVDYTISFSIVSSLAQIPLCIRPDLNTRLYCKPLLTLGLQEYNLVMNIGLVSMPSSH